MGMGIGGGGRTGGVRGSVWMIARVKLRSGTFFQRESYEADVQVAEKIRVREA